LRVKGQIIENLYGVNVFNKYSALGIVSDHKKCLKKKLFLRLVVNRAYYI